MEKNKKVSRIIKSTEKQRKAVKYCEEFLYIEFEGNIMSARDCSEFLNLYLEEAKDRERELYCEYSAYIWEKY